MYRSLGATVAAKFGAVRNHRTEHKQPAPQLAQYAYHLLPQPFAAQLSEAYHYHYMYIAAPSERSIHLFPDRLCRWRR